MRALFLSLLLLLTIAPADAQHNIFLGVGQGAVSPIPPSNCPQAGDNGCAAAPLLQAGSTGIQYAGGRTAGGAVNQLTQLTTNYAATAIPDNYPGIDYGVGQYTPYISLDTNLAHLPPECVYSATGSFNGGPSLVCTPLTTDRTISGFDFTLGGTTCIPVEVTGNGTGKFIFINNYWKNITGNCTIVANVLAMFFTQNTRTTGETDLISNTFDADRTDWPYQIGSCAPGFGVACTPTEAFVLGGNTTVHYNYFKGFIARPIQFVGRDSSVGVDYRYNVLEGGCSDNTNSHCELTEANASASTAGWSQQIYDSNTWIMPTWHHNVGPSPFPSYLGGQAVVPFPNWELSHNFIAVGPAGGATISPALASFSGTMVGNTLTVNSLTAGTTYGSGMLISTGGSGNQELQVYPEYTGSTGTTPAGPGGGGFGGAGSTWPMNFAVANIGAGLDNGAGGSGNVLTVTVDTSLTLETANGGTEVTISGTRLITGSATTGATCGPSACTGTGGPGTYLVNGTAANVANGVFPAVPPDPRPGGWTIPGTLSFTSPPSGPSPTSTPGPQLSTFFTQASIQNNSWDMSIYNAGNPVGIWADLVNGGATNFSGAISGTTLTVVGAVQATGAGGTATTCVSNSPVAGQMTVTAQVAVAHELSVGATYTMQAFKTGFTGYNATYTALAGTTGTTLVGETTTGGGTCPTSPVTPSSNEGTAGSGTFPTAAATNRQGLLTTGGVIAGTYIVSGTAPIFTVSQSQTVGLVASPVALAAFETVCVNPVSWGGNVDTAGINGSTVMNSFGSSANLLSGCGP